MHCPMWEKGGIVYALYRSIQRTYHVYASLAATGEPPKLTKFETDKEKLRRTIRTARKLGDDFDRAAVLEALTINAQNAAKAAETPAPKRNTPGA